MTQLEPESAVDLEFRVESHAAAWQFQFSARSLSPAMVTVRLGGPYRQSVSQ